MLKITKKDTATLSNVLNEMVCEGITFQQLRFFLIYLAKINPADQSKTKVLFALDDFAEILGIEFNESNIDKATDALLKIIVRIRPEEVRKFEKDAQIKCQLFSVCRLFKDTRDEKYYLEFDSHPEARKEIFNLAKNFTSIQIWNILNLHSLIDSRMYMLLKQYKTIGERIITIKELKKMLGIAEDSYPEYKIFARDILKKTQKSLSEKTDICFDYKAIGRPAHSVKLTIRSNEKYEIPEFLKEIAVNNNEIDYENLQEETKEFKAIGITETRQQNIINNLRQMIEEIMPVWLEDIDDYQILELNDMMHLYILETRNIVKMDQEDIMAVKNDLFRRFFMRARSKKAEKIYNFATKMWDVILKEID